MIEIVPQRSSDGPAVEALLDLAFGPDRKQRPSYRLRDGIAPVAGLSFVARNGGRLAGTVRFWPVTVGGRVSALLLGPIAVHRAHRGRGIGGALIARGLADAGVSGHRIVAAIGDRGFLGRFGFAPARNAGLAMPMPVDEARFLALALVPGALDGVAGVLGRRRAPSLQRLDEALDEIEQAGLTPAA